MGKNRAEALQPPGITVVAKQPITGRYLDLANLSPRKINLEVDGEPAVVASLLNDHLVRHAQPVVQGSCRGRFSQLIMSPSLHLLCDGHADAKWCPLSAGNGAEFGR